MRSYLFSCLEAWDGGADPTSQPARSLRRFILEFLLKDLNLIDTASNTPPGDVLVGTVTLPVYSEVGIILTFNQPEPSLVTIYAPRLYREWLIQVILMPRLLVRILDGSGYDVGGGQGPENEGSQKVELRLLSVKRL